ARRSMLPELAKAAGLSLARMSAAFEGVTYLALLVGPAVAGVLVSVMGAANVLWIDAATFAFSAALIGAVVRLPRSIAVSRPEARADRSAVAVPQAMPAPNASTSVPTNAIGLDDHS